MQVEETVVKVRKAKTQNDTMGIIDVIKLYFRFILNAFLDDSPMSYCVMGEIRRTHRSIRWTVSSFRQFAKTGQDHFALGDSKDLSEYVYR